MNSQMNSAVFRHFLTLIAGGFLVSGPDSLDGALKSLLANIATGDTNAIVGASVAIFTIVWSLWTKASEETKTSIVKTLTFKK